MRIPFIDVYMEKFLVQVCLHVMQYTSECTNTIKQAYLLPEYTQTTVQYTHSCIETVKELKLVFLYSTVKKI